MQQSVDLSPDCDETRLEVVLGEDDFVLVVSEGSFGAAHSAF